MAQELKVPATPEDVPKVTTTEEHPVTDDLPDVEVPAAPEVPSQKQPESNTTDSPSAQPAVTVVPPLTVKPIEQEPADSQPVEEQPSESQPVTGTAEVSAAPGFTGADLAACTAANSDFAAWLQIPGTDADYPVVLTNDVDYYLDHTFTGQESIIGCLFSLGRTDYAAPSQNIAIYGHHMRRSRSTTMFQPLHEYKSASFRDAHATIHLDTLHGSRTYTVFAVINKRESDWDASAADFASADEYQAFLDRAMEWSLYDTGVSVTTDDHILTLITCDRDYNAEDGQLVVMAVQQ